MQNVFRTPNDAFASLPGFSFAPHYLEWNGLRTHYLDEGPQEGPVALLLHGEPTWSYLYRHMIPPLVAAGYRCIAPDHIGFGKSDKVTDDDWYTIGRHVTRLEEFIQKLDLRDKEPQHSGSGVCAELAHGSLHPNQGGGRKCL